MAQMPLFDCGELVAQHHADDPESSVGAARTVTESGALGRQAAIVLSLVRAFAGATCDELAAQTTLNRFQVARRLSDLKRAGHVLRGAPRVCRVTGRRQCVWRLI